MNLYQHFRKEERPFINQVLTWKNDVEVMYQNRLTDFLNPREQQIVSSLLQSNDESVNFGIYGGHEHAERKRALLLPFYEVLELKLFEITVLQATYSTKFIDLEHPDVLGSFLSLGIDRKKIGEIIVKDGIVQLILTSDIAVYVQANFTQIKNTKLTFKEIDLAELRIPPMNWLEVSLTVSSLRLDAVLSEIYKISRKKAQEYISKKLVKVNFKVIEDMKLSIAESDMISLRGKGRSKVIEIHGKTRKERIHFIAGILQ